MLWGMKRLPPFHSDHCFDLPCDMESASIAVSPSTFVSSSHNHHHDPWSYPYLLLCLLHNHDPIRVSIHNQPHHLFMITTITTITITGSELQRGSRRCLRKCCRWRCRPHRLVLRVMLCLYVVLCYDVVRLFCCLVCCFVVECFCMMYCLCCVLCCFELCLNYLLCLP